MAQLSVRGLKVRYGRTEILRGVDFDLADGEIVALLGANGSGKSTALNAVSGFVRPAAGSIRIDGQEVAGEPTHRLFRRGVVQVSQGRDLFPHMSVDDNLALGMAYATGIDRRAEMDRLYGLFPRLSGKRGLPAQALSGGEQQMIAIGRALASHPQVILLDEPSGGLAPRVVEEIAAILLQLKRDGHTMLLVEQNVSLATAVADRFYILRKGLVEAGDEIVRSAASPEDIVRSVYL